MMGHGKHCNCLVCSMGKKVGMIHKCDDKSCEHPSHKNERGCGQCGHEHKADGSCDCGCK